MTNFSARVTPQEFVNWRVQLGLSRHDLAAALQVHYQTITYWETGRTRIPSMLRFAIHSLERKLPLEPPANFEVDGKSNKAVWATWLAQQRMNMGLTQEEISRILGVSVSTVGKWEGKVNPVPYYLLYVLAWIRNNPENFELSK